MPIEFRNPYAPPPSEHFKKANWKERIRQLFIGTVMIIAVAAVAMFAWEYGLVPK
jgi:hypothetical protein